MYVDGQCIDAQRKFQEESRGRGGYGRRGSCGIRARGICSRLQISNGGYHVAPMRYDLFMRTTVESIVVDAVALGDDWGTTVH